MLTSINEVKTFRECRRKWYFSGRNGMYLRPKIVDSSLRTGSAFHAALEAMYKQESYNIDNIIDKYKVEEKDRDMLKFQIKKYEENVLKHDLETINVIASEFKYSIELENGVTLFGFIDVVYEEKKTGDIGALEHKFVRNLRSDVYNYLDEQIKAYELAILKVFGQCNAGVSLNQVRKLKTKFEHARDTYKQTRQQLKHFYWELVKVTDHMRLLSDLGIKYHPAEPHWMGCSFCEYKDLCLKMNQAGTNDTTILTEKDIENAGLIKNPRDIL